MNNKIYYLLRSMYRFMLLHSMEQSPKILIEMERYIFEKRFKELSKAECVEAIRLWPEFVQEAVIEDARLDALVDEDLKNFQTN